jgi:hypothetical protein
VLRYPDEVLVAPVACAPAPKAELPLLLALLLEP